MALISGGSWVMARREPLVGRVLIAVGIGAWNLALFAATRLYDLIPVEVGLAGVLLGSIAAAAIAIRANAQEIAALGLIVALAGPPILHAQPTATTIAYIGAILLGTTAIALWRNWAWLPRIAFLLSAPQVAAWLLGRPSSTCRQQCGRSPPR